MKNRVDHGYDSPEIEISYGGKTYEMDILKFNHSKSVDVFEFFYHYQKKKKKKKIVLIYSPYKELFDYGIAFEKTPQKTKVI